MKELSITLHRESFAVFTEFVKNIGFEIKFQGAEIEEEAAKEK